MTRFGHQMTGAALGIAACSVAAQHGADASMLLAVIAASYFGSLAPDTLEISRFNREKQCRESLIEHRTLTHWVLGWLAVLGVSLFLLAPAYPRLGPVLVAYSAGALLHLALDIGTPTGVPLLLPCGRRTSLHLYNTGDLAVEFLLIALCFGVALFVAPFLRFA